MGIREKFCDDFFNIEIKEKHIIKEVSGVVAVVSDISGKLIMVLENENKPWKRPGQWSVVMETKHPGEDDLHCLYRGLFEELGIEQKDVIEIYTDEDNKFLYVKAKNGWIRVSLKLFKVRVLGNVNTNFSTGEIKKVKFFTLEDIISELIKYNGGLKSYISKNRRPGTIEAILNFENTYNSYVPKKIFVENGEYLPVSFQILRELINKLANV